MFSRYRVALVGTFVIALGAAVPVTAREIDFGPLVGYLVFSVETIDRFEGCPYGERIDFEAGGSVECADNEPRHRYAYRASAAILASTAGVDGTPMLLCKLVVGGSWVYDVICDRFVRDRMQSLVSFRNKTTRKDLRAVVNHRIEMYEAFGLPY